VSNVASARGRTRVVLSARAHAPADRPLAPVSNVAPAPGQARPNAGRGVPASDTLIERRRTVSAVVREEDVVATIDFALAVWREEGLWRVEPLPEKISEQLDTLVGALRAQPGEGGVLGLVSIAEDFFVLARVVGDDVRLLVSDVYAAEAYPLGLEVLDRLGPALPPDDDDSDEPLPGGDLRIVEDFGMPLDELELLLDDLDLYPDEQLGTIAARIGFGEQFDSVLEDIDA
jgi:putative tRNA adenosine deaminase-associated protein